jgi:hypothetical protein
MHSEHKGKRNLSVSYNLQAPASSVACITRRSIRSASTRCILNTKKSFQHNSLSIAVSLNVASTIRNPLIPVISRVGCVVSSPSTLLRLRAVVITVLAPPMDPFLLLLLRSLDRLHQLEQSALEVGDRTGDSCEGLPFRRTQLFATHGTSLRTPLQQKVDAMFLVERGHVAHVLEPDTADFQMCTQLPIVGIAVALWDKIQEAALEVGFWLEVVAAVEPCLRIPDGPSEVLRGSGHGPVVIVRLGGSDDLGTGPVVVGDVEIQLGLKLLQDHGIPGFLQIMEGQVVNRLANTQRHLPLELGDDRPDTDVGGRAHVGVGKVFNPLGVGISIVNLPLINEIQQRLVDGPVLALLVAKLLVRLVGPDLRLLSARVFCSHLSGFFLELTKGR